MELKINGIAVSMSDDAVSQVVRERLLNSSPHIAPYGLPLIGKPWKDGSGIYAGYARGVDGQPDYPLIVGEYLPKRGWKAQLEQEKDGWRVPYRRESALCFANVPELFDKDWHWTREQYEAYSGYAWAQHFGNGSQNYYRKGSEFRVRLVRSVIVIE